MTLTSSTTLCVCVCACVQDTVEEANKFTDSCPSHEVPILVLSSAQVGPRDYWDRHKNKVPQ